MKLFKPCTLLSAMALMVFPLSQALAVFPDPMATVDDVEDGTSSDESFARAEPSEKSEMEMLQAFRYGKSFIASRLYKPAVVQLEQALEVMPEDADANYYMGLAYIGLNEPATALPFLSQAISSDDDYYPAYEQLGLLYLEQGDATAAKALGERLADKAKACADACSAELSTANASLQAALEGRATTAVDPGTLLLDSEVEISVVYRGAIAEINQGNYLAAIDLLKKTKAEAGPHPDVLTYLGFAYRKLQQYEQAITYYRQALTMNANHKAANEYLGELYVEIGDLARAGLQLEKLDELCPFSCAEKEELQRWIGLVD